MKDNKINYIGITILVIVFLLFYGVTVFFLDERKPNNNIVIDDNETKINDNYEVEKTIVLNLYQNAKILYDVVNNKFKVSQSDTILVGDLAYKKITNFNEVTENIFTSNGIDNYIATLKNYFVILDNEYYLAGNLVSYQTYYFRGDQTNIYITNVTSSKIETIIYERWTGNNTNTLATIEVVKENDKWLINNVTILSTE